MTHLPRRLGPLGVEMGRYRSDLPLETADAVIARDKPFTVLRVDFVRRARKETVANLLGAIAGAGATWATFGNAARNQAHPGATVPSAGVSDVRAFVVEALMTLLLVFVIMAVATDPRVPAALVAPSIGFVHVAAVLIAGGAVNPDRASGPAIMSGTFTSLSVYLLASIVGDITAALLYDNVVAKATAPTTEHGDPQSGKSAGDRNLATGSNTTRPSAERRP